MFYYSRRILLIILRNVGCWGRIGLTLRYIFFTTICYTIFFGIGYQVAKFIEHFSTNINQGELTEDGGIYVIAPLLGFGFIIIILSAFSCVTAFLYWLWNGGCCCEDIEKYYRNNQIAHDQIV